LGGRAQAGLHRLRQLDLVRSGEQLVLADLLEVLPHQVLYEVGVAATRHSLTPGRFVPCATVLPPEPRSWYPPACWVCGATTAAAPVRRPRPCGWPTSSASSPSVPKPSAACRRRARRRSDGPTGACVPPTAPMSPLPTRAARRRLSSWRALRAPAKPCSRRARRPAAVTRST